MSGRSPLMVLLLTLLVIASGCGLLPGESGGAVIDPTPSAENVTVRLFFPTRDSMIVLAEEREVTVEGSSIEESAVVSLLEGPESTYLASPLPPEARLISLEILDGVAYVNLSGSAARVEGPMAEMAAINSLLFTLTEFSTVSKVQILIEGKSNVSLGGDFILGEPVDRYDFGGTGSAPRVAARSDQILVFSPLPDRYYSLSAPLWGIAQVHEANLVWELWVDGALWGDGFTTATDFDWGMFSTSIPICDVEGESALLRVYSPSAEDGSPMHTVEIPLALTRPEVVAESGQIKVFSPAPGTVVSGNLYLTGIAQVFEGTLVFELLHDGKVVKSGFATTTDWDWGTFDHEIRVPAGVRGNVTLHVFSPSAKDGSRMFEVEIPLTIE